MFVVFKYLFDINTFSKKKKSVSIETKNRTVGYKL